jgi:hypothetical protein
LIQFVDAPGIILGIASLIHALGCALQCMVVHPRSRAGAPSGASWYLESAIIGISDGNLESALDEVQQGRIVAALGAHVGIAAIEPVSGLDAGNLIGRFL